MRLSDAAEPSKVIDYRFRILYALGIIFVVAGHCGNGGFSIWYEFIPPYAFHLQLFAFSAGYFYKSSVEDSPVRYIQKKLRHLIIPYYIWNFIYAAVLLLIGCKGFDFGQVTLHNLLLEPLLSGQQFMFNLGGWFVFPLFFNQAAYMLLHKYICGHNTAVKKELLTCLICFGLGFMGIWLSIHEYNQGWWLTLVHFLCFMPFYCLGYFYKAVLERYDTVSNVKYFSFILTAELLIILKYGHPLSYMLSLCQDFNEGLLMPVLAALLGIAFWLRAAKIMVPAIGRSRLINIIGSNTFAVMLHHFMGFMLVKTVFAVLAKFIAFKVPFDWLAYKTDMAYFYVPDNITQFYILYLVSGIMFPIAVQLVENKIVAKVRVEKRQCLSEIFRFCIVGAVTLLVDYGLLYFLTDAMGILYLYSAGISYTAATLVNYWLCVKYVFKQAGKQTFLQSAVFVGSSFAGLGLNQVCMWFLVEYLQVYYILAKLVSTVIVTLWNYVMKRKAVMGSKSGGRFGE